MDAHHLLHYDGFDVDRMWSLQMSNDGGKPRLAIYGTGQFGLHITQLAVQKGWPVVAAYNRAGTKVGEDIGRLAGIGHNLGVKVQDCETATYDGLQADIGVVTLTNRLGLNLPAYRRLLGAGLNVICHGTEAYYPFGNDAALATQIDQLAKQCGVSFCGAGIWDMSRIWSGILTAGPCTELRSLFHSSITDCSRIGIDGMLYTGVGKTPEQFAQMSAAHAVLVTYKTIPQLVLNALGYTMGQTTVRVEPVIHETPIDCPLLDRVIPAGECAGTRIVAEVVTREGVTARANIELRLFREGEVEHMYWEVDGRPISRTRTEREDSAFATAASLFNRIPDVIAAPPGIVLLSQLGPLRHTALIPRAMPTERQL